MTPSLVRRAVAEFLGTAFLVFFGAGAVVMDPFPNGHYATLGIALVHALILGVAVTATMGISGGQLNPAITLGLLSIKRINARDAGVYIVSQLLGGIVAAVLVRYILPSNVGHLVAYGAPTVNAQVTFGQAVALEAIMTFVLASMVMGTVVSRKAPSVGGFGVGLTLFPAIVIGAPLTGAALNPARAFGPALMSGQFVAQPVWWIGPILGAILAMQIWERVLLKDE